jgi:hypothetical protein
MVFYSNTGLYGKGNLYGFGYWKGLWWIVSLYSRWIGEANIHIIISRVLLFKPNFYNLVCASGFTLLWVLLLATCYLLLATWFLVLGSWHLSGKNHPTTFTDITLQFIRITWTKVYLVMYIYIIIIFFYTFGKSPFLFLE